MAEQWRSGVLARLQAAMQTLGTAQRQAAEFILASPETSVHLSAREIGERCHTSESAVVRLSQSLGYEGYKHLRLNLAHDLSADLSLAAEEIQPGDGVHSIADKLQAAYIASIENTTRLNEPPALEQAVARLASARRLEIWGHGGNVIGVTHAHHHFVKLGLPCHWSSDASVQFMVGAILEKDSVVLAFSNTGRNPELAAALSVARESGAGILLITGNPRGPLTDLADVSLFTALRESVYAAEPLTTPASQLYLTDILFIATVQTLGLENNLRATQTILGNRWTKTP